MNRWITKDKAYYRDLAVLAVPVALQNLIAFLVSFADNLMVSSLGDCAVSGVYLASQMQVLLQLFTSGVGGAIVIIGAQYWGRRDLDNLRKIAAIGIRTALYCGLAVNLICALAPEMILRLLTDDAEVVAEGAKYLRAVSFSFGFFCVTQAMLSAMRSVEVTMAGLGVSAASLLVNVTLNYALIFGKFGFPAMGVTGAAIATVAARAAETAIIAAYMLAADRKLELKPKALLDGSPSLRRDFLRYGTPLVLGEIVWSINMMVNSAILGRYGQSVTAAASVANTMNTLAYVFIGGLAAAVGIITGKTVGAGKTELMKEYARTTQLVFLALGALMGAMIFLLRGPFTAAYAGLSPEASAQALELLAVLSVTIMGTCYQMPCLFGLVKSGGDISFVFKNDTIFVFGAVLPASILAAYLGAPAWVTFACLKCDQVLKCAVAVVKVNRFNWMKKLTREAA